MWVVVRFLLVLQPTSLRILTDASVFSPSPETRLWGQFSYICLFCFGILCSRVSRGVSPLSSFPVVCLPPSLCHPQLLVSLSVFLLVPSWSICHFSSVVRAPSSPTSSLPLVSPLFLSFVFSPLVSELLSLIPPPPPPTLYSAVICDFGKEHIYWGGISPWQRSRWWLLINLAFFFFPRLPNHNPSLKLNQAVIASVVLERGRERNKTEVLQREPGCNANSCFLTPAIKTPVCCGNGRDHKRGNNKIKKLD